MKPRPTIPVQEVIRWVSEARPDKDIGLGMTFYIVRDDEIRATNGNITAGYPWFNDDVFLVSGLEFEKVLARMDDPVITPSNENYITVRSGKFHATIGTLPPDTWGYPGVDDAEWREVPNGFVDVLRALRAFIPDKPSQIWMGAIALENGYAYATNGMAVAGSPCDVGDVQALLPANAADFILRRPEGLEEWSCNANYAAFKWRSGAWMRTQLVEGRFSERAAGMVREAHNIELSQPITDQFRDAFATIAGLAEDDIRIYSDRMESRFKKSEIVAPIDEDVVVPPDREENYIDDRGVSQTRTVEGGVSIWGAAVLAPVISQATHWSPDLQPAPFRGDNIAGLIAGRKA